MRKIVRILGMVLAAGLIIGLGYYVKLKLSSPPEPSPAGQTAAETAAPGGTPAAPAQPAASPAGDYKIRAFFAYSDGTLATLGLSGEIRDWSGGSFVALSSTTVSNVSWAEFSPDGQKILIKTGGGTEAQFRIFNLARKDWRFLPSGLRSPAWSPDSRSVVFFDYRGAAPLLSVLNLDASVSSAPRSLAPLALEDGVLSWPEPGRIYIGERASAWVLGSVWSFDMNKKTLSPVARNLRGLDALWAADGQGLVFSANDNLRGGGLKLYWGQGQNDLNFITLPEKCAFFSSDSVPRGLVCAVPGGDAFAQAALPDDYYQSALAQGDDFYAIDTASGVLKTASGGQFDAVNLRVANGKIFFLNRLDDKLYSLPFNPK